MISLTLLPSQSQAKLGPHHSIAGEPGVVMEALPQKPAGGSLSFASRTRKDTSTDVQKAAAAASQSKVKVRLAEDAVLLPFHNRPAEIKELLTHTTTKNKQLMHSLERLFVTSPDEWNTLQTLFFKSDREELGDKDWLAKIYTLVFTRSPSTWCRLADCLGAHALDWSAFTPDGKDDEDDISMLSYDDDVFTESSSSGFMTERNHARSSSELSTSNSGFEWEALHEIPASFRMPPIRARKPSSYRIDDEEQEQEQEAKQHRSLHHRRGSSVLSTGQDHDVHQFLTTKVDGFAGIRLSCSGQNHRTWSPMQKSQSLRTINTFPEEARASNTSRPHQRSATVSGLPQQHKFTHHRRLSTLFTSPIEEQSTFAEQKSGMQSRIQPTSKIDPSQETRKRTSPALTFARSFSAPRVPTKSEADVKQDECKLGLLPDGRTRHPSAGDGEGSKEATALLAFKRELQLSKTMQKTGSNFTGSSSSSLSSVLSPTMSEDSYATTVSTTASSPVMSKRSPPEMHLSQQLSLNPPTPHQHQHHPNALIFPFSSSLGQTRSKHLLSQLHNDDNNDVVSTVKSAIGQEAYKRICRMINEKERNVCSDQTLLEGIARNCFDLVDQEKDNRDVVEAHLVDENYQQRWDAFVKLCQVWDVDSAVIREAKRRCGPAVRLF